jgi:anti-repressor protein
VSNIVLDAAISRTEDATSVDARLLHAFLESKQEFSTWIKNRVKDYGFLAGVDYEEVIDNSVKNPEGGRPTKDYALTIDMAKELCMVERNAKGKEARLYFIEMERQARNVAHALPKSLPEALRLAASLAERAEQQAAEIKELAPKAVFHDRVASQVDSQNVNEVAKVLGTGEYRLWDFLKNQRLVFKEGRCNVPYQQYVEQGFFKLVQRTYTDRNGEEHAYTRTLVTGKGLIWLQKKWDAVHQQSA